MWYLTKAYISLAAHIDAAATKGEWIVRSWRLGATDSFVIDLHIQEAKQLTLATLLFSFRSNPSEFHIRSIYKQASVHGIFPVPPISVTCQRWTTV